MVNGTHVGGSYVGSTLIFARGSGALVGVYDYSDTPFGSCTGATAYLYGEGLFHSGTIAAGAAGCDDIAYCTVCGQSTDAAPPCQ